MFALVQMLQCFMPVIFCHGEEERLLGIQTLDHSFVVMLPDRDDSEFIKSLGTLLSIREMQIKIKIWQGTNRMES